MAGGRLDAEEEDAGGRPEMGGRPARVPCDDAPLVEAEDGVVVSSSGLCVACVCVCVCVCVRVCLCV